MAHEQITLYTAKISPYAQRVEIALTEARAEFKKYEIELNNKPEWYAEKVNPANQVPAIAYGGPDVPPDDPSPLSEKLNESLVLDEFVADLFPEADLLPRDPVLRARARIFIDAVSSRYSPALHKFVFHGGGYEDLLKAIEKIQSLLLLIPGPYAVGEYSIADIAIAPLIARLQLSATTDIGKFQPGQGGAFLQALLDDKYARYNAYVDQILARPSTQQTFDYDYVREYYARQFGRE